MPRFVSSTVLLLAVTTSAAAGDWPQWRGPQGTGVADEQGVPTEWSATENVTWKTPLPDEGNSTPIVFGDRVFITQATESGRRRAVMCFDRADGQLLWDRAIEYTEDEETHETNPYCSASPVTDGERVIAWHGSAGIVAYDYRGRELWHVDLGRFAHIWGNAGSPVLWGELVILLTGPGPNTYLAALHKRTGEEVWKRDLPEAQGKDSEEWVGSWSTPVLHTAGDHAELLVGLPGFLTALDPNDGREIWRCGGLSKLVYTSPLVSGDTVVAMSGYMGPAVAARTGGEGDVTQSHRLWLVEKNPQRIGSGVIVGDHIFILNEPAIAHCIELATGNVVWQQRLGETSWSSMACVDGRLYVIDMAGETFILAPETKFRLLARNSVDELTRASLAFSDGQIFIRTYENLYCIGQRR